VTNKLSFWRYDKSYENVVHLYNVPWSDINVRNGCCASSEVTAKIKSRVVGASQV
jgi:hypothetical protein